MLNIQYKQVNTHSRYMLGCFELQMYEVMRPQLPLQIVEITNDELMHFIHEDIECAEEDCVTDANDVKLFLQGKGPRNQVNPEIRLRPDTR